MRPALALVATLLCTGCLSDIRQHALFHEAAVASPAAPAQIGDVVPFEVNPQTAKEVTWELECHGRTRFSGDPTAKLVEWAPNLGPIRMEAVVSPWEPRPEVDDPKARGWLTFSLKEMGSEDRIGRPLPVRALPFHQISSIAVKSGFFVGKGPKLDSRMERGRTIVTFLTPTDVGTPRLPDVRAALFDTNGKKILFAEVVTDFGEIPSEPIGYAVDLSYPSKIEGPVEVVVVNWVAHGSYWAPFVVERYVVNAPPPEARPPQGPSNDQARDSAPASALRSGTSAPPSSE